MSDKSKKIDVYSDILKNIPSEKLPKNSKRPPTPDLYGFKYKNEKGDWNYTRNPSVAEVVRDQRKAKKQKKKFLKQSIGDKFKDAFTLLLSPFIDEINLGETGKNLQKRVKEISGHIPRPEGVYRKPKKKKKAKGGYIKKYAEGGGVRKVKVRY